MPGKNAALESYIPCFEFFHVRKMGQYVFVDTSGYLSRGVKFVSYIRPNKLMIPDEGWK